MTTAVDTNIFLSILAGDTLESTEAGKALLQAASDGPLVTSIICYAELVRQFNDQGELDRFLANLGYEVIPLDLPSPSWQGVSSLTIPAVAATNPVSWLII